MDTVAETSRLRIAFFSPLRPVVSGISDYCEELLPYLARGADLTLFVDGYQPSNPQIRDQFPIHDYHDFAALHGGQPYDVCLYHMGNNASHTYIYEMLLHYPGVVVLHDCVLHHFLADLVDRTDNLAPYLDEFAEEGGYLHRRRVGLLWSPLDQFLYPGIQRVAESSWGILVHSASARQSVLRAVPSARVEVVRHHWGPQRSPYADLPAEEIKVELGFSPDTFLVVSPGIVTPSRRIPATLQVFAAFIQEYPHSRAVIAGPDHPHVQIQEIIHNLGLDGLVQVTGFTDVPTFQSYILAADVLVNLRYPLAGETSGGLVRALGMGKPVLVSNAGQYAEFPDDCCLKVDLGRAEEPMALAYLRELVRDPELGRRVGRQARRYVQTCHTIERSAATYLEFLSTTVRDRAERRGDLPEGGGIDVRAIVREIRRNVHLQQWAGTLRPPDLSPCAPPPE